MWSMCLTLLLPSLPSSPVDQAVLLGCSGVGCFAGRCTYLSWDFVAGAYSFAHVEYVQQYSIINLSCHL